VLIISYPDCCALFLAHHTATHQIARFGTIDLDQWPHPRHSFGARLIKELYAALKAYEQAHPDGLEALEAAAENFVPCTTIP
jgi:hypothetical protein